LPQKVLETTTTTGRRRRRRRRQLALRKTLEKRRTKCW
jgi:hypothetical protein